MTESTDAAMAREITIVVAVLAVAGGLWLLLGHL